MAPLCKGSWLGAAETEGLTLANLRLPVAQPQTKFAVGVFLYKSAATSQALRASIPTPFVPSGHFPLIGGIGPWEGSLI